MVELKAKLHSMENDMHDHKQPAVTVHLVRYTNSNHTQAIVATENGISCTAIFNWWLNCWMADDLYGLVNE